MRKERTSSGVVSSFTSLLSSLCLGYGRSAWEVALYFLCFLPWNPTDNISEHPVSPGGGVCPGGQGWLQGVALLLGDACFHRTLCSPIPGMWGFRQALSSRQASFPLPPPQRPSHPWWVRSNPGVWVVLWALLHFRHPLSVTKAWEQ